MEEAFPLFPTLFPQFSSSEKQCACPATAKQPNHK